MLYQRAAQRAIQCPERCNKGTIYYNKDTSVLEAMLGASVDKKKASRELELTATQNSNLRSSEVWCAQALA